MCFQIDPQLEIEFGAKIRVPATKLHLKDQLERYVEIAARDGGVSSPILILLDCEDDCPARLGPELLRRAAEVRSDRKIFVALAHREFETWFLAAAKSLRGKRGLPHELEPPANPEAYRGAKEWLSRAMRSKDPTASYKETVDQEPLAALFNLAEASRIPSFARLERKLRVLIEDLKAGS